MRWVGIIPEKPFLQHNRIDIVIERGYSSLGSVKQP